MKIKFTIGEDEYIATMNNSKSAKDFIALLPMTLTLKDYVGREKISDLPKRLSTAGSPGGTGASIGDLTFYAPWGTLAIFYRDFGHTPGLIKLGTIDNGGEKLASYKHPIEAKIDLIEE